MPPSRRRRYAIGTAAVVLVAAAVAVTVALHHSGPPAPPDARAAGVAVVVGNTVYLPDGRTVELPVPDGAQVGRVVIVPAGYLYDVSGSGAPASLRLAEGPGAYQDLGMLGNSDYRVSPDGRTAVVIALDAEWNGTTTAIDLATGTRKTNKTFETGTVINVAGDWALLRDDNSPNDTRATALWNYRTGAVVKGADPSFTEYGVLASGAVLRGIHVPPMGQPTGPLPSCYAVVPTAEFSAIQTGYCGREIIQQAWLSPTGDWALATVSGALPDGGDEMVMLRVADLAAGRWTPVALDPLAIPSEATFWDSPTSIVIWGEDDYLRCTTAGTCTDLHLPLTDHVAQTLGIPA